MGCIRVLPDAVINRIAAGEVVERPASVVKEIVENSLDAGAVSVAIRIEEGGRRLIEVRDDGEGMDADDTIACLERHATSKLRADSALQAIGTLGFRGEAIPSIAAVSRFTLTTGRGEGEGARVVVEGGRLIGSGPAPHPRGTTVSVRDLFFNTPARRRFLRAPGTEMAHIVDAVTALALSRPALRVRLEHGSRMVLDVGSAPDLRARLSQMEGAAAAREAAPIGAGRGGVSVSGFVVGGETTGASRGTRRFVVNGRVVRDRMLAGAASKTLEEMLPAGSAASCLLILEVPAEAVDVNVHPAKAEVRFAEPGMIFDLVRDALRQALGRARPIRSAPAPDEIRAQGPPAGWAGGAAPDRARRAISEAAASYVSRHDALASPSRTPSPAAGDTPYAGRDPDAEEAGAEVLPRGVPRVVGHYRSGYILAQDEDGLILVDQHAAHERILFEEMTASETGKPQAAQALLFPKTVTLPARMRSREGEILSDLASLGFDAEAFGGETIVVRAVPAPLGAADPERLVLDLLAARDEEDGSPSGVEGRRRRMLATAACHAAVKVPAHLTPEKIEYILNRLLECRSPLRCPHGRPTMLRWEHRVIERRFGRP